MSDFTFVEQESCEKALQRYTIKKLSPICRNWKKDEYASTREVKKLS